MSTLLVEIGCEELPYKVCESVVRQLDGPEDEPGLLGRLLEEARLLASGATSVRVLVSPRRIAALVADVPPRQTPLVQEFRGPRVEVAYGPDGRLSKAGEGFARSRGARPEDVRRSVVDGTEFVVVTVEAERRDAAAVLPDIVAGVVRGLQIARGMRWGSRPAGEDEFLRFSRPIRWVLCKLGAETVQGSFYGLAFGDVTQGHRVLGAPLVVDTADHYEKHLREQKVVASQHERRRLIVEGLDERAAALGGRWSDPGDVLAEAVYLAEWPSVARGAFAERHLRLPDAVLVTAMQSHQRYFPVRAARRPPAAGFPLRVQRRPRRGRGSSRAATSACSRAAWTTPSSPSTATWPRDSTRWPTGCATSCSTRSSVRSPTRRRGFRGSSPVWPPGRAPRATPPAATAPAPRSGRRCAPRPAWPRPTS